MKNEKTDKVIKNKIKNPSYVTRTPDKTPDKTPDRTNAFITGLE